MTASTRFLSVDPGSFKCGAALWVDGQPAQCWLIEAPQKDGFEERSIAIGRALEEIVGRHKPELVACERPFNNPEIPGHEINMIFKRVKRIARECRIPFLPYHQSTVRASVRPRGFGRATKGESKERTRLGVCLLYGEKFKKLDDNVIDAIAVGHCHLAAQREAVILEATL